MPSSARSTTIALLALTLGASSAPLAKASTAILVSVPEQKLILVRDGEKVAQYKISTSKFGIGDKPRSYSTPLGKLQVAERIGDGLPAGAVLKGRQATGEVLPVNAKGRDPIVTRILHLRGLEACNANAYDRGIYIHGTPVERTLGKPDSWGCIRMRSQDVMELFAATPIGTTVEIVDTKTRQSLPGLLASTKPAPAPVSEPAKPAAIAEATKPARTTIALSTNSTATNKPAQAEASAESKEAKPAKDPKSLAHAETLSPKHLHITSVSELPSLGGVEGLKTDSQDRRSGVGMSLSIW